MVGACGLVVLGAAGFAWKSRADGAAGRAAERGRYLVSAAGCSDCHTPSKEGPNGPEPDMTRMLSGHPESLVIPPPPSFGAGPWLLAGSETGTAFAGRGASASRPT
jgi:hypothetical protein